MQVGLAGQYTYPADKVRQRATRAEERGWSSIWWPDAQMGYHPTSPAGGSSPHETYDWGPLVGAAAGATSRVRLGVAVTDPFRRHPLLLAQTAQTLQDLSAGRFILGLGLGALNNLEPIGLSADHSVDELEEAIDIMRLAWSTTEPITFLGRTWTLRNAVLGLDSSHVGEPAIWLGGAGPASLRLTARKADGWLPVMMPADVYGRRVTTLRREAEAFGRDPAAVEIGCLLLTVAAARLDECERLLDTPAVKALALFQPDRFFRMFGSLHPLGKGAAGVRSFVPTDLSWAQYCALVEPIPTGITKKLVMWGDTDRIVREARGPRRTRAGARRPMERDEHGDDVDLRCPRVLSHNGGCKTAARLAA